MPEYTVFIKLSIARALTMALNNKVFISTFMELPTPNKQKKKTEPFFSLPQILIKFQWPNIGSDYFDYFSNCLLAISKGLITD